MFKKKRKQYLYMKDDPRYAKHSIGRYSYGTPDVISWDEPAKLKVGAFSSIAGGVQIYMGGEHPVEWVSTYPFCRFWKKFSHIKGTPRTKGDVVIGNDVWIGAKALILSGITIGDGAVVGAGSVVTRDVEPYTIVGGNPAKPIRKRFSEDVIAKLLHLKWWDWELSRIEDNVPLLLSNRLDEFFSKNPR